MREIQIILLLEFVIGEFIGLDESSPPWHASIVDDIHTGDLSFFTAIKSEFRNLERFAMTAQDRAAAFVKPFRRDTDFACGRTSAFDAPLVHAHAVCERRGLGGG